MIEVERIFGESEGRRTDLWLSRAVVNALASEVWMLDKLDHWTRAGFTDYTGKGKPIRYEWDGVHRIGTTRSQFRLIGFYDGKPGACFIAIDAFTKRKQQLSAKERRRIDEVARVRRDGRWRRVE